VGWGWEHTKRARGDTNANTNTDTHTDTHRHTDTHNTSENGDGVRAGGKEKT
jgi:hypothetical protein